MDQMGTGARGHEVDGDIRWLALALIKWQDRIVEVLKKRGAHDAFQNRLDQWNREFSGTKADEIRQKGQALWTIVQEFELATVLEGRTVAAAGASGKVPTRDAVRTRGVVRLRDRSAATDKSTIADLVARVAAAYRAQ